MWRDGASTRGDTWWPPVVAVVLAVVAAVETASRHVPDLEPRFLPFLISLGVTLPVALVGGRPAVAFSIIVTLMVLGALGGVAPSVGGVIALLIASVCWGRRFVHQVRADSERRVTEDRRVRASLLDHAARGERVRIAHDLHDVVAHHISMIAMQAEAARLAVPGMPVEGAARLSEMSSSARSALAEMRRLLGVLREDDPEDNSRRPQPGLRQLPELINDVRRHSGTSTRLIVRGRQAALDPAVELTAYRIIQEALTNSRRHATGAAVDVELSFGEDALDILVRDNGTGSGTEAVAGHGLTGMRERAAAVGGTVAVTGAGVGGFVIEASLPTRKQDR